MLKGEQGTPQVSYAPYGPGRRVAMVDMFDLLTTVVPGSYFSLMYVV